MTRPRACSPTALVPVILAGLLVVCSACQKRIQPGPPRPPNYLELGDKRFNSGDYALAAQAYDIHLQNSSPKDPDRALFHLALCHAFEESAVGDLSRAMSLFRQLLDRFPQSRFRPQARLLLRLREQAEGLRSEAGKREERIRALSQELEKLKQVDMQRRPAQPSR